MNGLKLLDLWVFVGWGQTDIFLVNKNDLYAISGISSLLMKNRFPIPQGKRSDLVKRISCDFKARLARFAQMRMSKNAIYLYTLLDFSELTRLGYPHFIILGAWNQACQDTNLLV